VAPLPSQARTGIIHVDITVVYVLRSNRQAKKWEMPMPTLTLSIAAPCDLLAKEAIRHLHFRIGFWIAQEIADSKYTHDARTLFKAGVKVAGKKPMTLITDGLPAYHEACNKEFWTMKKETRTEHIRHITIKGDRNNNKMERMNGEVRDREKTMRGLKTKNTAILSGYQLFHNWIRPHEGLNGRTPSEACGIKIEGENKWITIIQNASHLTRVNS
jgi:hypothetical protein